MIKSLICIYFFLFSIATFTSTDVVADDQSGYERIHVDEHISIFIPRDWIIADENVRRTIGQFVDAMPKEGSSDPIPMVITLAADSPPPTRATVRVLYLPTPDFSQSPSQEDIGEALRVGRDQMIEGLSEAWQPEIRALARDFYQHGIQILDHGPANIESIDGWHTFTYTYRHTDFLDKSESWRVKQYHIHLGEKKAVLTFSYIKSSSGVYEETIRKMKESVDIK